MISTATPIYQYLINNLLINFIKLIELPLKYIILKNFSHHLSKDHEINKFFQHLSRNNIILLQYFYK